MFTLHHPGKADTAPIEAHGPLELPRRYASSALINATADSLFDYADDYLHLSSHMSKSSWMMGGGRMDIETDAGRGRQIGSRVRISGRVFAIQLCVEEAVTERNPPHRKVWATLAMPRLLVIGHYRMGFEITPQQSGSMFRVFIDYALPDAVPARWVGYLFAGVYAKWCTQRMILDAKQHFARPT